MTAAKVSPRLTKERLHDPGAQFNMRFANWTFDRTLAYVPYVMDQECDP
jgi:hypothetical protein